MVWVFSPPLRSGGSEKAQTINFPEYLSLLTQKKKYSAKKNLLSQGKPVYTYDISFLFPPLLVKYLKLDVLSGSGEKAQTTYFSEFSVYWNRKKNTLPKSIYSDNGNPFIPMLFLFYAPPGE